MKHKKLFKFGWIIAAMPGLRQDGTWPLSAEGIERGEVERAFLGDQNHVAVFEKKAHAMQKIAELTPEGSTPESYAGLHTRLAMNHPDSIDLMLSNWGKGMDGFVIPEINYADLA